MKKLLFLLFVLLCSQSLLAQSGKLLVSDSTKPVVQQQLLFQNRIIGKTDKGTVYALPQDNLPVLVPDSAVTSNMPVSGQKIPFDTKMPNPFYPGKPEMKNLPPTNKGYQYKPRTNLKKKIE